jgi:DNA-binding transcriptional LysR family regulator
MMERSYSRVWSSGRPTDRVVDPATEGVDTSLRLGDHGGRSFIARKLGEIGRVLVAAPSYLERKGTPHMPRRSGAA